MAPKKKCANREPGNPAPMSSRVERLPVPPANYERCHAPVNWPPELNEDTGEVRKEWAQEMIRIRMAFWRPLGAGLFWRWTTYTT